MIGDAVSIIEAAEARPFFEFNYSILFILLMESVEKNHVGGSSVKRLPRARR